MRLKYVSGNPQNAGFDTICPTASGGLWRSTEPRPKCFSLALLTVLHLLFQYSLLLLKVLKALPGFSKCAGDRRFRRLLSHSRRLKIYQACVFQQFLCLCELSLSRFVDLVYLLIDYFYYCNQPNTNKSTIF